MSYVNSYTPPPKPTLVLPDPAKPYDVNFCFPVKDLESDRIVLTPVIPHIHGQALFESISAHPETVEYMSSPLPATFESFKYLLEESRADTGKLMFAILDKSKIGNGFTKGMSYVIVIQLIYRVVDALLGTASYIRSSATFSVVSAGFIIVFPPYQRTHVHTHAAGLLLRYALDSPKDGGLGVRRFQWQAHASNKSSVRAAERLGLKMEGTIRWVTSLPVEKEGSAPLREGDPLGLPGAHGTTLAMCWDDWEQGGREHIRILMERKVGT